MTRGGTRKGSGRPVKLNSKRYKQFMLPPDLIAAIQAESQRTGKSQNAIAEEAIVKYLKKKDNVDNC